MSKRFFTILASLCSLASPVCAQFVRYGTEAPSVRWNSFSTENYRFVYPAGCDSLALVYAREWEMAAKPVGATIGYTPNAGYKRPLPVILHPFSTYSNGIVVWAPRRMVMYTSPEMYTPDPLPWQRILAIHENRHACQQQYSTEGFFGAVSVVAGEIASGIADALCYDVAMFEGDAVVTETSLSKAGRGRSADFLEYYRVCFDEDQERNYWQWRYGSLDRFTPDYYKIGYLVQAGVRAEFSCPDFMGETYRRLHRKGAKGKLDNFNRTIAECTGLPFKEAYDSIMTAFGARWAADLKTRAPFQPERRITEPGPFFESYSHLAPTPDGIFAVRSGLASASTLVRIDAGGETPVCTFSSETSPLQFSHVSNRLYWTEYTPDIRYEMHSSSILKWMEPGKRTQHTLAGKGKREEARRYFNPSPCPVDSLVAVAQTLPGGTSGIVILDESDGSVVKTYPAPDGLLVTEPAWVGDILFTIGLSSEGTGIYRADGFLCVLEPSPVKINHLRGLGSLLYFTCDLNGENELYSLNPANGKVVQETNLPRGGKDFFFAGDTLFFTSLKPDGRMIYSSPVDSLPSKIVDFSRIHKCPEADVLSAGEPMPIDENFCQDPPTIQRYSELGNLFRVHSWLPAWADYDEISSLSLESLSTSLAPGATVFFQNDLSTFAGYAGFSYAPLDGDGWGAGGHVNLGYYGFLPVMKATLDFDRLGVRGTLSSHIPLNFSGGGWLRGVIPNATFSFSGPRYGYMVGVRAYVMRPVPSSCIYPKFGAGIEGGIANNKAYGLLYCYLPGFLPTHGLFASLQHIGHLGKTDATVKYALPFASVDWNWGNFIYVRNFELYPQYSFTSMPLEKSWLTVNSFGLGADAVLGNLWIIKTDMRVGVQYVYAAGMPDPHRLTAIFSVEL